MKYLWFISIALIFTLSSCTLRRIAIKNVESLACLMLSDEFDLSSRQKERFCQILTSHIQNIKSQHLSDFLKLLKQASKQTEGPLTIELWNGYEKELQKLGASIWHDMVDDTIDLYESLNEEQKQNILSETQEDFEELLALAQADKDDFKDIRIALIDDYMDRYKQWIGDLNVEQEKLFIQCFSLPQDDWRKLATYRVKQRQEFLSFMAGSAPRELKRSVLLNEKNLWLVISPKEAKERIEFFKQWRGIWRRLLEGVLPTLTLAQRKHLKEELMRLHDDLKK